MGVAALMAYLYPRVIPVHDLAPDAAFADAVTGRLVLPTFIPASYLWMEPDGAYLMGASSFLLRFDFGTFPYAFLQLV